MRKAILIFIASVTLLSGMAGAQCSNGASPWTPVSLARADVQSCINDVRVHTGDVIQLPSATATWTTTVGVTPSVTLNKCVTVQGNTTCPGTPPVGGCTDLTIINDGTTAGFNEIPLAIVGTNGCTTRWTGTSLLDPRAISDAKAFVQTSGPNVRVDHNKFDPTGNPNQIHCLYMYSSPAYTGLADHNFFKNCNGGSDVDGSNASDLNFPGDWSWTQAMTLGGAGAIFLEDNAYEYTLTGGVPNVLDGAYDAYAGARLVFRHNDVTNTNIGGHGLDSGALFSVSQQEVYNNTFTNQGTHIFSLFGSRGGTHLQFNNTTSAANGSYDNWEDLDNYRSNCNVGECGSWGNCDGTSAGGSPAVSSPAGDENLTSQQGYKCRNQIGRGSSSSPSTDWDTVLTGYTDSETSWPGYAFGAELYKGSAPTISNVRICGFLDCVRAQAFHIINNRDFYVPVASFTGATGTGTGLLAGRPGTCAPFVAYFATDQGPQGTLYQCTSTNTWTSYYQPYTYPHPLQGSLTGTLTGGTFNAGTID